MDRWIDLSRIFSLHVFLVNRVGGCCKRHFLLPNAHKHTKLFGESKGLALRCTAGPSGRVSKRTS